MAEIIRATDMGIKTPAERAGILSHATTNPIDLAIHRVLSTPNEVSIQTTTETGNVSSLSFMDRLRAANTRVHELIGDAKLAVAPAVLSFAVAACGGGEAPKSPVVSPTESQTPVATVVPSEKPTVPVTPPNTEVSPTPALTAEPTIEPTEEPTSKPTVAPTVKPTPEATPEVKDIYSKETIIANLTKYLEKGGNVLDQYKLPINSKKLKDTYAAFVKTPAYKNYPLPAEDVKIATNEKKDFLDREFAGAYIVTYAADIAKATGEPKAKVLEKYALAYYLENFGITANDITFLCNTLTTESW